MKFFLSVWGLCVLLGIWLVAMLFVYCQKRKWGKCQKCPHYGEVTIYERQCYYDPQCLLGMLFKFRAIIEIGREIKKTKDEKKEKGGVEKENHEEQ